MCGHFVVSNIATFVREVLVGHCRLQRNTVPQPNTVDILVTLWICTVFNEGFGYESFKKKSRPYKMAVLIVLRIGHLLKNRNVYFFFFAPRHPNWFFCHFSRPRRTTHTGVPRICPAIPFDRVIKLVHLPRMILCFNNESLCSRTLASAFGAQVICNRIVGLTAGQRRICAAAPDAMAAVGHGIRMAKQECQQQFSGHRWNCTGPSSKGNPFGHLQITGKTIYVVVVVVFFLWQLNRTDA